MELSYRNLVLSSINRIVRCIYLFCFFMLGCTCKSHINYRYNTVSRELFIWGNKDSCDVLICGKFFNLCERGEWDSRFRIRKVIIGDYIDEIGPDAFFGDIGKYVEEIEISDHVKKIGSNAFCGCTNLMILRLPSELEEIPFCLCEGCVSLIECHIPNSVKKIGDCAFLNCNSLTIIGRIPKSATIGKFAFANCNSLILKYTL